MLTGDNDSLITIWEDNTLEIEGTKRKEVNEQI